MEVVEDIEEEILDFVNSNWRENQIKFPLCNQDDSSEWVEAQNKIVRMLEQAHMPNKSLQTILDTSLKSIRDVITDIKINESHLDINLYKNADLQLKKLKQLTA